MLEPVHCGFSDHRRVQDFEFRQRKGAVAIGIELCETGKHRRARGSGLRLRGQTSTHHSWPHHHAHHVTIHHRHAAAWTGAHHPAMHHVLHHLALAGGGSAVFRKRPATVSMVAFGSGMPCRGNREA